MWIESLANCKGVITRNTTKLMKDNEFRRVPVRDFIRKKLGCGTLYVNDVVDVLR